MAASQAYAGNLVKVGPGMFSRSLLFDTDLVTLKAQRQAAQQDYHPGQAAAQVFTPKGIKLTF